MRPEEAWRTFEAAFTEATICQRQGRLVEAVLLYHRAERILNVGWHMKALAIQEKLAPGSLDVGATYGNIGTCTGAGGSSTCTGAAGSLARQRASICALWVFLIQTVVVKVWKL